MLEHLKNMMVGLAVGGPICVLFVSVVVYPTFGKVVVLVFAGLVGLAAFYGLGQSIRSKRND